MKKIAFTAMTMQPLRNPLYSLGGKSKTSYNGKINFPLNVALAENLDESDELTVCIIKVTDGLTAKSEETFRKNEEVFRDELSKINESIGAKIQYKIIESDFSETRDAFGKRFMEMFEILENGCKIYADITFGTKPTSMLTMNILYFAEKFYDADIESVVYGKTVFKELPDGRSVPDPDNSKVCDVTILYLFNNLTNAMEVENGEKAKKIFRMFFGM